MKDTVTTSNNPYDKFIYHSYPSQDLTPEKLRSVAKIFGINAPNLENARVLELGCADGNNLLRFAQQYQHSYTLGVDLSKVEIDHGLEMIKALKINNIELKCLSITDLDESYGKFDYIICHGVFSWVPKVVQDKIFEVCRDLLSANGISYISYNVYPGWNMTKTVRDIMLFHASNFTNDNDKISQARACLSFVDSILTKTDSSYAEFIQEETLKIAKASDQYIRHEYLAEENTPIYFHQFIERAKQYDLQYLSDVKPETMYIANLPQKAQSHLSQISNIIQLEQYMDFIRNRRFRCTLLTHSSQQVQRSLTTTLLKDGYFLCPISSNKDLSAIDIRDATESVIFTSELHKNSTISVNAPMVKAILYSFAENSYNHLTADEITKLAHKKLPTFTIEDFQKTFDSLMMELIFRGICNFSDIKYDYISHISEKPKISELARYQASITNDGKNLWITDQMNNMVMFNSISQHILTACDGNNTVADLEQIIFNKLKDGSLKIMDNTTQVEISDEKLLKDMAKQLVNNTLSSLKQNFALIS